MKFKKLLSLVLVGSMITTTNITTVSAANKTNQEITVIVNGQKINFDVKPYVNSNGRTMVPVSKIAVMLDANVSWFPATERVVVKKDGKVLELVIGSDKMSVDGQSVQMDTKAEIVNGRSMVPVSIIAKAFDAKVGWDNATETVTITTENTKTEEVKTEDSGKKLSEISTNEELVEYISKNIIYNEDTVYKVKEVKASTQDPSLVDITVVNSKTPNGVTASTQIKLNKENATPYKSMAELAAKISFIESDDFKNVKGDPNRMVYTRVTPDEITITDDTGLKHYYIYTQLDTEHEGDIFLIGTGK